MMQDLSLDTIAFAGFLAFCRIGACFMLLPGFGSLRVSFQVRLFLSIAVTWALVIHLWESILPYAELEVDSLVLLVTSEVMIGSLMGLLVRYYVLALQFAASTVAMVSGFNAMVGTAVEEDEPQTAMTALITFSALILLFSLDFHHEIVRALIGSYAVAPLATLLDPRAALVDLADTLSEAFYIMIRLGSPFIAFGLLVNLATGFVNKLAPQIPIYFIVMPFLIAGSIMMMYFGLPTMLALFGDGFLPTTLGR